MSELSGPISEMQFTGTVEVDGQIVSHQVVEDPFQTTVIVIGWWDRFKSLLSLDFEVKVILDGNREAVRQVMQVVRNPKIILDKDESSHTQMPDSGNV